MKSTWAKFERPRRPIKVSPSVWIRSTAMVVGCRGKRSGQRSYLFHSSQPLIFDVRAVLAARLQVQGAKPVGLPKLTCLVSVHHLDRRKKPVGSHFLISIAAGNC